MSLSQIESLAGYLQEYGKTLSHKAIHSLSPLHVPGKDPVPAFSYVPEHRTPFEAQAHLVAGAVRGMSENGACFIIGEPGCIAGESMVYDPVARQHRRVDEIEEDFHVLSEWNGWTVIGKAKKPIRFPRMNLYRVTLSSGRSFLATREHRLLTPDGWRSVSFLDALLQQGSAPVPLVSSSDISPSGSPQGALHSTSTTPGSTDRCCSYRRPCDEPLHGAAEASQASPPSRDDAAEHNHASSHGDDPDSEPGCSHACPGEHRHSTQDSPSLLSCDQEHGSVFRGDGTPCEQDGSRGPTDHRSVEASSLPRTTASSVRSASQSDSSAASLVTPIGENVSVTNVEYERTDVYYDFTVDYGNYLMEGVVHHNCGKTLSASLSVHEHAQQSRRKGGYGGRYRAIVICPDHLISKWKNEIEDTIPGAVVHCWRPSDEIGTGYTLEKWWDFLKLTALGESETKLTPGDKPTSAPEIATLCTGRTNLLDENEQPVATFFVDDLPVSRSPLSGQVLQHKKRWKKPVGPEWIVLGRDQIKRQPDWLGLGQLHSCYDRKVRAGDSSKAFVTDRKPETDELGNPRRGPDGRVIVKPVIERRIVCPKCGTVPTKKGEPLSAAALNKSTQHRCKARYLDLLGDPEGKSGGDRIYENAESESHKDGKRPGIPFEYRNASNGQIISHAGKKWRVVECGEPLWSWTRKPNWWPAARIVQKKLNKIAQYIVIDECHEQKSADSGQSMAMGKILGATRYCLALTGTFIGGYASHLFPLMMRMAARDMQARSFEWGKEMPFVERYGCIDRIIRSEAPVESVTQKGSRSMRKAKLGGASVSRRCRPGIMPTLFSEIVMPLAMFLKLEQFIDGLPGFEERMIACDLPPDIQTAYNEAAHILVAANRDLIANGNMKLMGTMLWTLLSYPDHPWGWEPMFRGEKPEDDTAAVGWWRETKVWTRENFVSVVSPQNFDPNEMILPKERELIKLVKENTEAGDQTWVYCEMTQKRDVMSRLQKLLEAEGLRVGVMRSGDVSPREREVWIQKNGYLYDVMLSHPQLVATGLDLFSVQHGNHNFNHLVFYQTGFNLFRLRQASRRAWRIGQPKDCTVTYLYYTGTSQAAALSLMGRKAQAAQQLEEGGVSDEGLAAMGGDAGAQAALVKALGEHVDPNEIQRNWSKVQSGGKRRASRPAPEKTAPRTPRGLPVSPAVPDEVYEAEHIPPPGVASTFDRLPLAEQIVGEAMIKDAEQSKTPQEALAEFREWLKDEASKPQLKVAEIDEDVSDEQAGCLSEPDDSERIETAEEKRLEDFSRDQLAAMFDRMRAGDIEEDDWEW